METEGEPTEVTAQTDDCWSCQASADKEPLCLDTAFFVSTEVLQDLRSRFGPTGTERQNSFSRYGWELMLVLLGPHRLQLICKERSLGVIRMLKKMVWTVDLLLIVLRHARQIYCLTPIPRDSYQSERNAFRNYCSKMISNLPTPRSKSGSSGKTRKRKEPRFTVSRGRTSTNSASRPLRTQLAAVRTTTDDPQSSSSSDSEDDHDLGTNHNGTTPVMVCDSGVQIKDFISDAARNNTSVSKEAINAMTEDAGLKEEVNNIMQIQQRLLKERKNHKSFCALDSEAGFTVLKQVDGDVHLPLDQIKELYAAGWSVKNNLPGWTCKHCNWCCLEEDGMQYHVSKRHFFRAMGVDGSAVITKPNDAQSHFIIADSYDSEEDV